MKILIAGKNGQVAWELERSAPSGYSLVVLGRSELDITDHAAVDERLAQERPDVVINAAAYTAVDKAESDSADAYAVNEGGAANLARACKSRGTRLVHISTDFVFNGSQSRPYNPADPTGPTGVYGASKLAGEQAVQSILPERSLIIRTAWVYSVHGNNFVKTMLRLMNEKPQLNVVYDQVGTPTWARTLARAIWSAVEKPELKGTLHWTDAGVASWYDFAVSIQSLALEKGLLEKKIPIRPIPSSGYPTAARRPQYSVLDKSQTEQVLNIQAEHWQQQLGFMLDDLNSHL